MCDLFFPSRQRFVLERFCRLIFKLPSFNSISCKLASSEAGKPHRNINVFENLSNDEEMNKKCFLAFQMLLSGSGNAGKLFLRTTCSN